MRLCCVAVCLCVVTGAAAQELPWYQTAVLYQIYPRSFKDSNGDGVGDIRGILQKADHFKELGVTAVWISPIYKSPMADFGYDISDYRAVDPIFGSLQDLKELLAKLGKLGIKLLLDLVPNHSSDEHEWFQKSVQRVDPYTNYYVWHVGKVDPATGKRIPPNNWLSEFGGPAWTWHEKRQQFYLHFFHRKQPDLNYRNPLVLQEMDNVIRFWLDIGIDGFRVDVPNFLVEDEQLRDEIPLPGTGGKLFRHYNHTYTLDQPETHDILLHWADVIHKYTQHDGKQRAMFLEIYGLKGLTYFGQGELDLMKPFNFQLLLQTNASSRASQLRDVIMQWMDGMPPGSVSAWVISNHDQKRIATRYGPEMVDAMTLLTGVLPGVQVVYNGDEIGMSDTYIRWDQTVDPPGLLLGPDHYQEHSRDPERTPMQWDDSISAGFSINHTTWMPVNPNYWWLNVAAQRAAQSSHLKVFQAMIKARQDPVLQRGNFTIIVPDNDTFLVVRKLHGEFFILLINMGSEVKEFTTESLFGPHVLDMDTEVVISSINCELKPGIQFKKGATRLSLRPKAAVLLQSSSSSASSAASHQSAITVALASLLIWWKVFLSS